MSETGASMTNDDLVSEIMAKGWPDSLRLFVAEVAHLSEIDQSYDPDLITDRLLSTEAGRQHRDAMREPLHGVVAKALLDFQFARRDLEEP